MLRHPREVIPKILPQEHLRSFNPRKCVSVLAHRSVFLISFYWWTQHRWEVGDLNDQLQRFTVRPDSPEVFSPSSRARGPGVTMSWNMGSKCYWARLLVRDGFGISGRGLIIDPSACQGLGVIWCLWCWVAKSLGKLKILSSAYSFWTRNDLETTKMFMEPAWDRTSKVICMIWTNKPKKYSLQSPTVSIACISPKKHGKTNVEILMHVQ